MDNTILIIDIETTDFLNRGGKIIEVGIVSLDLNTGFRRILFNEMVYEKGITKEECENSWIVKNTDITVESIRRGLKFDKALPIIQKIIDAFPNGVTAFNIDFDVEFLKKSGVKFNNLLPCIMKTACGYLKIPPTEKMKKAGFGNKFKNPNAQEAFDMLFPDTEYTEKHRGADDAFHEAAILYELYKKGEFKLNI